MAKTKYKPRVTSSPKVNNWRDSYDYRAEYFRHNPGLLGCVYFCAYCFQPLFGRRDVQVDHIYPPSRMAHKQRNRRGELISNTSILARTMNSGFNTVAACSNCNQAKSDKVGFITVRGFIAKIGEIIVGGTQKIAVFGIFLSAKGGWSIIRLGGTGIKSLTKLAISPFTSPNVAISTKLIVFVVYVGVVMIILKSLGVV